MPIFMDRHDVSEFVTAENVAQLHKEDLKIQDEFNCRGLTYWFDDIKKIAFCLVDAPNKESIQQMHSHAHGEVPNQILEVDSILVESFLGRIEDPVSSTQNELNIISDPAQRTLMAIRFTALSLKNYSISQPVINLQKTVHSIRELLKKFEGRLVRQEDSYLLVSFKSVYKSVLCAVEIENNFNWLKKEFGGNNFDINIGLASGMPVDKEKAFFEDTIKMADRLCFINKNNIVITAEVKKAFVTENMDSSYNNDELYSLESIDEHFFNELLNFIEDEWQNVDLKVNDFSSSLGMSKTLIYKKMISLLGQSPNEFIREYRLNRALEAMNQKMKNISEIAFETGFNNASYFSKCFQRRFDLLPSDYIKS